MATKMFCSLKKSKIEASLSFYYIFILERKYRGQSPSALLKALSGSHISEAMTVTDNLNR